MNDIDDNHRAFLVPGVMRYYENRIQNIEINFPISWILNTNIKHDEIYPDTNTIRSGYIKDSNNEPYPLYRSTRHTSTNIDFRWLWHNKFDEKLFPLIKIYFLNSFIHADIIYIELYEFSEVIQIRENIANVQMFLRIIFNKALERRKLKRKLRVYRSLFHTLDRDTINEIHNFM